MATKAEVRNNHYNKPEKGQHFFIAGHYNQRANEGLEPDAFIEIGARFNSLNIEASRRYKNNTTISTAISLDREQAQQLLEFLQREIAKPDWR